MPEGTDNADSTQEAYTQTITLPDDDSTAVQIMLEYVYTLQLPNWEEVTALFEDDLARMAGLFTISDKYSIHALKDYAKKKVLEGFEISVRYTVHHIAPIAAQENLEACSKGSPSGLYERQVIDLISLIFGSDDTTLVVFKAPMIKTMTENHDIFKNEKISTAIHWSADLASPLLATLGDALITTKEELKHMEINYSALEWELGEEKDMRKKEVKSSEAKSQELGQIKEELRRTKALLKEARESDEQGAKRPAKRAKRNT